MKKLLQMNIFMSVMALLAAGFVIYIMVAIPILKEHIFLDHGAITVSGEWYLLIGFVQIAIFNVFSILWNVLCIYKTQTSWPNNKFMLSLGILCLFLMIGEKVMIDEIGRELALGWEIIGEWIILYVFLAIQLFYVCLLLLRIFRSRYNLWALVGVFSLASMAC